MVVPGTLSALSEAKQTCTASHNRATFQSIDTQVSRASVREFAGNTIIILAQGLPVLKQVEISLAV